MSWYMWPVVAFPFVLLGLFALLGLVYVIDQEFGSGRIPRRKP